MVHRSSTLAISERTRGRWPRRSKALDRGPTIPRVRPSGLQSESGNQHLLEAGCLVSLGWVERGLDTTAATATPPPALPPPPPPPITAAAATTATALPQPLPVRLILPLVLRLHDRGLLSLPLPLPTPLLPAFLLL